MKLRKLLIICAIMAVMMTLLTVSVSAEAIKFDQTYIESTTTNETNTRHHILDKMYDGDINDPGLWSDGNSWFGAVGDYILITLKEETKITEVSLYVTGNYTYGKLELLDANNEVVYNKQILAQTSNAYGGNAEIFEAYNSEGEESALSAKYIKITTTGLKWGDNPNPIASWRTFKIAEIVINGIHEHKYSKVQTVISEATCSLAGSAVYECVCGLTETKEIPATGEHTEPTETVVFRDGFGKPGFKGTVCKTCDTQDVVIEEIGALFNVLGYSVCTFGDHGIQLGIGVNYDNIAKYTEITGSPVQFGTVIASRNTLSEGNPILMGETKLETVNDKILMKDLTNSEYLLINSKLTFDSSFDDTQLILAVYVYANDALHYIGEGTTYDVVTVSYNDLANPG